MRALRDVHEVVSPAQRIAVLDLDRPQLLALLVETLQRSVVLLFDQDVAHPGRAVPHLVLHHRAAVVGVNAQIAGVLVDGAGLSVDAEIGHAVVFPHPEPLPGLLGQVDGPLLGVCLLDGRCAADSDRTLVGRVQLVDRARCGHGQVVPGVLVESTDEAAIGGAVDEEGSLLLGSFGPHRHLPGRRVGYLLEPFEIGEVAGDIDRPHLGSVGPVEHSQFAAARGEVRSDHQALVSLEERTGSGNRDLPGGCEPGRGSRRRRGLG